MIEKNKMIEKVMQKEWTLQPEYKLIVPGRATYNAFGNTSRSVVDFDQPWHCYDKDNKCVWIGILSFADILGIYGENSPYLRR